MMVGWRWFWRGALGSWVGACAVPTHGDCTDTLTCPRTQDTDGGLADGSLSDASPEGGEGDAGLDGTACDPKGDPATQGCAISDNVALFVDPTNGVDTNDGTKAHPLLHLGTALDRARGGKDRIYACGGPQPFSEGTLTVTMSMSIYGGFTCVGGDWRYSSDLTVRSIVTTNVAAPAIVVLSALDVRIVDFDFRAMAAPSTAPGASSIAGIVQNSQRVTFERVALTALEAANGASGDAPAGQAAVAAGGGAGSFGAGGVWLSGSSATNSCTLGHESFGGGGGSPPQQGGASGTPGYSPSIPDGATGEGGKTVAMSCGGIFGSDGPGGGAGAGATTLASLTSDPLVPVVAVVPVGGQPGELGSTGQGGGGGATLSAGGAGGGGGAGGCGGAGGAPGTGGGSSIALVVAASHQTSLSGVRLTASSAGTGGNGGGGQVGQLGGPGGAHGGPAQTACDGASGGAGGSGGGGGGGAGGLSIGLAWQGDAPLLGTLPANADGGADTGLIQVAPAAAPGGQGGPGGLKTSTRGANEGTKGSAGLNGIAQPLLELR